MLMLKYIFSGQWQPATLYKLLLVDCDCETKYVDGVSEIVYKFFMQFERKSWFKFFVLFCFLNFYYLLQPSNSSTM